jgi:hypothetical protein
MFKMTDYLALPLLIVIGERDCNALH